MSYGGDPPSGQNPSQHNWGDANPPPGRPAGNNTARILLIVAGVCALGMYCMCLPAALLLPAIQNAREAGRRAVCMNNIRNLGLAIASYESNSRTYPGYRESLDINTTIPINGVETNKAPVNWLITVLPSLERADLYRNWKNMTAVDFADNGQVTYTFPNSPIVYQELLVCPSDPQSPQPLGKGQPMSYVVNSGLQDVAATTTAPADWPENGVFVSRWEMPPGPDAEPLLMVSSNADNVSRGDGVSQTLLLSESTGARNYDDVFINVGGSGSLQKPVSEQWTCFVWQPQYPLPENLSQANINGLPATGPDPSPSVASNITYARPSSSHPGGANFVFCDIHTKFISQNIDYLVLTLLMMSNDRQARAPGTGAPLPKDFTTTELRDEMIK